jgi:hypothetical protein
MENTSEKDTLFDMSFDNNVKTSMRDCATWAGMAAIISLINSIIGLIQYFMAERASPGGLLGPLISLGIGIALFVFLNKFSRLVKSGVDTNDTYIINEGLGNLSTYFKFTGVLIIIILVLVLLGLLIALSMGA